MRSAPGVGGELPAFFDAVLEAELDRFADVAERVPSSAPLADAARDRGTLRDDEAVLAGTQDHGEIHRGGGYRIRAHGATQAVPEGTERERGSGHGVRFGR